MKKVFIILLIFSIISSCDENIGYLGKPEYLSLSDVLKHAQSGDPRLQDYAGKMYFRGIKTEKNLSEAIYWFKKAAYQEYVSSQVMLGLIYAGGLGVDKSCEKAINWFRRATINGSDNAKSNWAYMLATCDDSQYRNGELALRLMKEKINENGADIADLDNIAAALAEIGKFDEAVKTQEKVVNALKSTNQAKRLKSAMMRLEYYKTDKPWRESSYIEPDVFSNGKGARDIKN